MFEFSENLAPLKRYLEAKHVDITSIRSARELVWLAQKLTKNWFRLPKDRSESLFPALNKIQTGILKKHPEFGQPSSQDERARPTTAANRPLSHREKVAAKKAPRWLRDVAAKKFDPTAERAFKERRLGTFGPAGPVKLIDPAEYLAAKARGEA